MGMVMAIVATGLAGAGAVVVEGTGVAGWLVGTVTVFARVAVGTVPPVIGTCTIGKQAESRQSTAMKADIRNIFTISTFSLSILVLKIIRRPASRNSEQRQDDKSTYLVKDTQAVLTKIKRPKR